MVSVIVLSYNTKELTLKCLERVLASRDVEIEVIVVDNDSKDGSAEAIEKRFPKVKLIKNKENVGFARGNNQAMKLAKGEKILLLNSDAFVFPDTIAALAKHPAEVLGCKLLNGDGSIQPSWGYFPTLPRVAMLMSFVDNLPVIRKFVDSIHVRDLSRYEKEQQVDWVTGALVMLKREVWEKAGGIDEKYFMYGEEMEWMYRIKKAGFNVTYFPGARAEHLQGSSTKSKANMFLSEMKGYLYWYKKHNSSFEQLILKILLVKGCVIRIPAWVIRGKIELAKAYAQILPQLIRA